VFSVDVPNKIIFKIVKCIPTKIGKIETFSPLLLFVVVGSGMGKNLDPG
jgi:hypothetical protein